MMGQESYPTWKGYLLRLQQQAPKPKPVSCLHKEVNFACPHFYGEEFHGLISREEGESLCQEEGNFLIRESQREKGSYTFVMRVLNVVKNYKIFYQDGMHYVGDKRFDSVYSLAEDGLITMYVEDKAQDYIAKMPLEPVYDSLSRYSSLGNRLGNGNTSCTVPERSYPEAPSPISNMYCNESYQPLSYYVDAPTNQHYAYDRSFSHNDAEEMHYRPGYVPRNVLEVPQYQSEGDVSRSSGDGDRYSEDTNDKFNMSLPEESMRRLEGGMKKNLTPTSSDERKRTKKRIATENHVLGHREILYEDQDPHFLEQERLLRELASGPNSMEFSASFNQSKPRRASHDHYRLNRNEQKFEPVNRRMSSDVLPTSLAKQTMYHRPTVAHKQLSTVAHVRHLNATANNRSNARVNENGGQDYPIAYVGDVGFRCDDQHHSPYHSRDLPVVEEGSSLDQLMAVHRHLEEGSHVCDPSRSQDGREERRVYHIRQQSDPVEPIHYRESSFDGQDPGSCKLSRISSERLFRHNKPLNKTQLSVQRTGSIGSCESGLSTGSSGVERIETSSSSLTHDSVHLSSEDDRGSPSPRHPSVHHQCNRESPQLYRSPQLLQESRTGRIPQKVEESPWKRRSEIEDKLSRSRSSSATRKRAPLSLLNPNSKEVSDNEKVTSKKNPISSSKLTENVVRRNNLGNDPALSSNIEIPAELTETNLSDLKTKPSPKNKEKQEKSSSKTKQEETTPSDQRKHKPLVRRATTSDVTSKSKRGEIQRKSGSVKEKSNKPKQTEEAKQKLFSPTKTKKSPAASSPSTRHRVVTSPSRGRPSSSPSKSGRSKGGLAQQYDKEHHFKSHTYRGLQWCEYCGNFMWGIIQQGVQCLDCGLNVHKQCSKLVPSNCQPALKHVKHAFGIDLTTLVKLHGTERPMVVDMCVDEIERRGMDSEGIYRVSGSQDQILELKAAFDQDGPKTDLSVYEDINIIADALKLYLRELPVPLLPYQLYSRFINAAKISRDDGKLNAIRMGLSAMPGAHLQTLKYLIFHLGRVSEQSFLNQMNSQNLGVVFGPTLLRTPEKEMNAQYNMNDTQYQQDVIATMIEFRHYLFGSS